MSSSRPDLSIAPIEPEDLAAVRALLRRVGLPVQGVGDRGGKFFKLTRGERLVGTVGLEEYGTRGLLRSLALDPRYRGRGWGRKLCRAAMARARSRGLTEVYLLTDTEAGFFGALGFEVIARESADPGIRSSEEFRTLCPESAVCMRSRLD